MSESVANSVNVQRRRGILFTVLAVLGFIGLVLALFIHGLSRPIIMNKEQLKANGIFLFEQPRSFKPFQLLNDDNQAFTMQSLQGKWSLVFFGFTYCPDVCPTTLVNLKRFYEKQLTSGLANDTQIILVSVDPARDTPAVLKPYVDYFNADFIGVTGEFLDIHRFATQLNIPFNKVTEGNSYRIEHSANVVLINPQGYYVGFIRAPLDVAKMDKAYPSIRYWFTP